MKSYKDGPKHAVFMDGTGAPVFLGRFAGTLALANDNPPPVYEGEELTDLVNAMSADSLDLDGDEISEHLETAGYSDAEQVSFKRVIPNIETRIQKRKERKAARETRRKERQAAREEEKTKRQEEKEAAKEQKEASNSKKKKAAKGND